MSQERTEEALAEFAHRCIIEASGEQLSTLVARFNNERLRLETERRRLEEERANMLDAEGIMMKSLERALRDDELELLSDVQ